MNLINAMQLNQRTTTTNGDLAYTTTGDAVLNYVALIGGMRNNTDKQILNLWLPAFRENPIQALQLLFYTRDVPNRGGGGLGERRIFHVIFDYLIDNHPDIVYRLAKHIPEYGYWKDVKMLAQRCFSKGNYELAKAFLSFQTYVIFTNADGYVLAAKYAVDENEKNRSFREFALTHICDSLNITRKFYRKFVVSARQGVVERLMSEQKWGNINYSQVPSKAMKTYRKAFAKHDGARFARFTDAAVKGEVKINSGTLNPVELYSKLGYVKDNTIEAQWRQLPNFVDENINAIVMADVSGSMSGMPIKVCISLAIYFAERNKGKFANHFMTFSNKPALQQLVGNTLLEKSRNLNKADWEMNTNLDAAFKMLLQAAVKHSVPAEEMPSAIIIITDGQFDGMVKGRTAFERMEQDYTSAGYKMPHVVFWNVNVLKPVYPAPSGPYVTLVSGYSASVLTSVFNTISNPENTVVDAILATGRYDRIAEELA